MEKILLQFYMPDGNPDSTKPCYYVPIERAWQGGPDDLHIQFKSADDNFFPHYDQEKGLYAVTYKGEIHHFGRMSFEAVLRAEAMILLDQKELEEFWYSPNRV